MGVISDVTEVSIQNLKSCVTYLSLLPVAYPGILFGGVGVRQIQLRTEDRENGDLRAVAP
jgi:hypothetical protein